MGLYGGVIVCVTTLDRGAEAEAGGRATDSILEESSAIRIIHRLAALAMDSNAERRQKIASVADSGLEDLGLRAAARDKSAHSVGASNGKCVRSKKTLKQGSQPVVSQAGNLSAWR